jgi:hypothetical protein
MKLEMAANQVLKQFSRQIRKEDASRNGFKWRFDITALALALPAWKSRERLGSRDFPG